MVQQVAEWDDLANAASEPNPFFESWYLLPALHAFDPHGEIEVLHVSLDGKLCGLLPITRTHRYYHLPLPNLSAWVHQNCFLGAPLVRAGHEGSFWEAVLAWADDNPRTGLFLHLPHLPLDGPLHAALIEVAGAQGRPNALVYREDRALLRSTLTPEAYLEGALSGKKRKELRRQFNRLCDEGAVAFERHADGTSLDTWIDAFLDLEAAGWKGNAGSALQCDVRTERLFRESLQGAAERGKLERLALTLNGRPVAMLATFLTPPGAFSFKTAFDETLSRFSPGVLLQRENLNILNREDIGWTDSCASADHPMIDHIWRERRAIGRISVAIGGTVRRAVFRQIARAETARMTAGRET
ncbi:MAG: GNAT family N-acetyltransferase [Novosphingobium sp.]|nr:GNAT family N-acetyltransferase [Novosphingobium sp.]